MKFVFFKKIIFLLLSLLFFACVSNIDEDAITNETVSPFPLKIASKWFYKLKINDLVYYDSTAIENVSFYYQDGFSKLLYEYKELDYYPEDFFEDTTFVRLFSLENNYLLEYGYFKQDEFGFALGDTVFYENPIILCDYQEQIAKTLYQDEYLRIEQEGIWEVDLNDSTYNALRVKVLTNIEELYNSYSEYYLYFGDLGILKIEGVVGGRFFEAVLLRKK